MEKIKTPKIDNVKIQNRFGIRQLTVGTLYLTATHIIFVDNEGKRESWILHMHIGHIERMPLTAGGSPLLIRCKNFMCITFIIPRERDCQDLYVSLLELSKPNSLESLYAFHFTAAEEWNQSLGWNFFDIQSEYLRMGVPSALWTLTNLNKNYELCDTYPSLLYVPSSASTPVLVGSSKFRSRGRLPALSYIHRENQASITRCSQPLAGFSARCVEDEQMLQAVLKANPKSHFMYVVDTRPKINAVFNMAQGKGYESETFYSNIKFQFLGIENIHVMRNSLQKLVEVCELKNPSMSAFLLGLEGSGWLKHISAILETSVFIANAITEGISVLVHCSDGWDRTAKTCSLAELILDPYYRTITGFQALIEKEWLSFGHKFTDRCGYLDGMEAKEIAPIFAQFLDCVWQLTHQFPCAFQFNERFLLTIFDHAYSCQFGTFIGNCEKDRIDLRLAERTYSLWGYLSRHMQEYLNPLFKKEYEITNPVLRPSTKPQDIRFWSGLYNRFENGIHSRENVNDILSTAKDHSASLEDHVQLLEKRIAHLCRLMNKSEDVIQLRLQAAMSVESLSRLASGPVENGFGPPCLNGNCVPNGPSPLEGSQSHGKSDSESGFDESGSPMSRSGLEEGGMTLSMVRSPSLEKLSEEVLQAEAGTVAVAWKTLRHVVNCSCATPFDHYVKKFHCWKCGEVFCLRCIARNTALPGHYSRKPVPVCRPCYKALHTSPSMEFPVS
ncbi:phosphatidylinositol-3,5-bisphosphate 3-phosphatase MTMR8-like isoform X2 [Babylonia areolata]|uniref:phosphatidylinositol-3,5-bisphosphate 3-phosphatase MTMR8-like isoform X2 n=1 Tax=Babylonia areolata TaxID=304850 RepID=UPI003FD114D3